MRPNFIVTAFFYDYDGDHHSEYREAQSIDEAKKIANEYYDTFSDDVSVSIYEIKKEVFFIPKNA